MLWWRPSARRGAGKWSLIQQFQGTPERPCSGNIAGADIQADHGLCSAILDPANAWPSETLKLRRRTAPRVQANFCNQKTGKSARLLPSLSPTLIR
jgi:hypothetical protein